jgi:hypothetical protein
VEAQASAAARGGFFFGWKKNPPHRGLSLPESARIDLGDPASPEAGPARPLTSARIRSDRAGPELKGLGRGARQGAGGPRPSS